MTPPQRMVAKSHPQSCYWIFFNSPSIFAPSGYTTWGFDRHMKRANFMSKLHFHSNFRNYFLVLLCIKCANFMSKLCFHSDFRIIFLFSIPTLSGSLIGIGERLVSVPCLAQQKKQNKTKLGRCHFWVLWCSYVPCWTNKRTLRPMFPSDPCLMEKGRDIRRLSSIIDLFSVEMTPYLIVME
jgi:hypothetical protein